MDRPARIAVLIGSLRKDSYSRKLAHILMQLAPAAMRFDEVPFRDLPLYDADLESSVPAPWQQFRDRLQPAEALLFVTPRRSVIFSTNSVTPTGPIRAPMRASKRL